LNYHAAKGDGIHSPGYFQTPPASAAWRLNFHLT
jgi:hypothetical protein